MSGLYKKLSGLDDRVRQVEISQAEVKGFTRMSVVLNRWILGAMLTLSLVGTAGYVRLNNQVVSINTKVSAGTKGEQTHGILGQMATGSCWNYQNDSGGPQLLYSGASPDTYAADRRFGFRCSSLGCASGRP